MYERPPHVYAIANDAYRSMLQMKENQVRKIELFRKRPALADSPPLVRHYFRRVWRRQDRGVKDFHDLYRRGGQGLR